MSFFPEDVKYHSSPIISFLGIFSLLGQSHVEQGREDEGQCGDKDGRDQLRKGWNRWFLLWKASVLFSSYLKDAGEGGQGLGEEEKQGDDQGAEDRPLDRELWYISTLHYNALFVKIKDFRTHLEATQSSSPGTGLGGWGTWGRPRSSGPAAESGGEGSFSGDFLGWSKSPRPSTWRRHHIGHKLYLRLACKDFHWSFHI